MTGHPRHGRRAWPGAVTRGCDTLLDLFVVLLATWTVVYHVALLLSFGVVVAAVVEGLVLAVAAVLWLRLRRPRDEPDGTSTWSRVAGPLHHRGAVVTVVAAAVSALAMAVQAPWFLVWPSWLVAALAGTWTAVRRSGLVTMPAEIEPDEPEHDVLEPEEGPGKWETVMGFGGALVAALIALSTLRSNPDDLFYLNISQWIAEHGSFPLRDTIFSNQALPAVNWPPVASYDGLVGAVAYLLGTLAGNIEYIVVPPLTSFLAVIALWRLLRAWRLRSVTVALAAALVFLLCDGTDSYATPGNLFVTRLWQGKVILMCVLLPIMLVRSLDHIDRTALSGRDRPPGRTTFRLFLTGVAAVGLSTSAMFLTPIVALAGLAPAARRAPRSALVGFAALAGYPLAAGVYTMAVHGRSADDFGDRRLFRFDPSWFGHEIFLTWLIAAVAVLSVLVGALLVPHPTARVTTGLAVMITGVTFVPGATRLSYDLTGLGPTLWRVSWICTIGALVGVATAWVLPRLLRRMRVRWVVVTAVLVTVGMALTGGTIYGPGTDASFDPPFHWQRSMSTREVVGRLIALNRPGDMILAPSGLAITQVITDTSLRTVTPRDYAMDRLQKVPWFHYDERYVLFDFANAVDTWETPSLARALRVVGVTTVCLSTYDVQRITAIRDLGYRPLIDTPSYECLRR